MGLDITLGNSEVAMKLTNKLNGGAMLITVLALLITGLVSTILINRQFEQYLYAEHNKVMLKIVEDVQAVINEPESMDLKEIDLLAKTENHIVEIQNDQNNTLYISSNFVQSGMMGRRLSLAQLRNMPMYDGFAVDSMVLTDTNGVKYLLSIAYDESFKTGAEVDRFKKTMYNSIIIAMGLSAFIGIALTTIVSKPIAQSVIKASENAKLITKGKDLSSRQLPTNIIELDSLHESIIKLNETLHQQETFRKGLVETLSHEVKTPLTVLNSHIDAFIDGVFTPDSNRLKKCKEEIHRIEELMNRIESINDLSTEGIILNPSHFDLQDELKSIRMILEPQFRKKSIQINTTFSGNSLVELDKYKLRQILYNLLSNALKFSSDGTVVNLSGEQNDHFIHIIVENTGLVINELEGEKIFDAYYRAEESNTYDRHGKGLGLRISQNISQAMGGELKLIKSDSSSTVFELKIDKQFNS